jgi:hypothetical protein
LFSLQNAEGVYCFFPPELGFHSKVHLPSTHSPTPPAALNGSGCVHGTLALARADETMTPLVADVDFGVTAPPVTGASDDRGGATDCVRDAAVAAVDDDVVRRGCCRRSPDEIAAPASGVRTICGACGRTFGNATLPDARYVVPGVGVGVGVGFRTGGVGGRGVGFGLGVGVGLGFGVGVGFGFGVGVGVGVGVGLPVVAAVAKL